MDIQTPGIHHLALRVTDYERSKHFYLDTLGFDQILENLDSASLELVTLR